MKTSTINKNNNISEEIKNEKIERYFYLIRDIDRTFNNKGDFSVEEKAYNYLLSNISIEIEDELFETSIIIKGENFLLKNKNSIFTCNNFIELEKEIKKLINISNLIITNGKMYSNEKDFKLSFDAFTDGDFKLDNTDSFFKEEFETYSRTDVFGLKNIIEEIDNLFDKIIKSIPENNKWLLEYFLVYENLSLIELLGFNGVTILSGNQDVSIYIETVEKKEIIEKRKRKMFDNTIKLIDNSNLNEDYIVQLIDNSLNGNLDSLNELISKVKS